MNIKPYEYQGNEYYSVGQLIGILDLSGSTIYTELEGSSLRVISIKIQEKKARQYILKEDAESLVEFFIDKPNLSVNKKSIRKAISYAEDKQKFTHDILKDGDISPTYDDFWSLTKLVGEMAQRIGMR